MENGLLCVLKINDRRVLNHVGRVGKGGPWSGHVTGILLATTNGWGHLPGFWHHGGPQPRLRHPVPSFRTC